MNSKCGAIVKACGATEQADGLRTMTTPDRQESCRNIVKCLFGGDRIKAAAFCTFQRMKQPRRSEEHTSELQSLMRISYAVFCLKKKNTTHRLPIQNTESTKITTIR